MTDAINHRSSHVTVQRLAVAGPPLMPPNVRVRAHTETTARRAKCLMPVRTDRPAFRADVRFGTPHGRHRRQRGLIPTSTRIQRTHDRDPPSNNFRRPFLHSHTRPSTTVDNLASLQVLLDRNYMFTAMQLCCYSMSNVAVRHLFVSKQIKLLSLATRICLDM